MLVLRHKEEKAVNRNEQRGKQGEKRSASSVTGNKLGWIRDDGVLVKFMQFISKILMK